MYEDQENSLQCSALCDRALLMTERSNSNQIEMNRKT